jgi:hypothetical protein
MKYLAILIGTLFIGTFILRMSAWVKGNESHKTYIVEYNASPSDAKKAEAGKQYYWKCTVHEDRVPSSIPGFYTTTTDTIDRTLHNRSAD